MALKGIALIMIGTFIALVASFFPSLYGIFAGFLVAMFGLGISEPALVSLTMASQKTALGYTAALMGAMHLVLSSMSTPISGVLLPVSMPGWFAFLLVSAIGSFILAMRARSYLRKHK